jgi:hypothetical protein
VSATAWFFFVCVHVCVCMCAWRAVFLTVCELRLLQTLIYHERFTMSAYLPGQSESLTTVVSQLSASKRRGKLHVK